MAQLLEEPFSDVIAPDHEALSAPAKAMETGRERVRLFGIDIDPLRMSQVVDTIFSWLTGDEGPCRFVVTPNADHAVMYQENAQLRAAYADASLVLADGMPVVLAARLLRRALPERVTGSDLTPALFAAAERMDQPMRVFLLGAAPGVADRAGRNITARWSNIQIVGAYSPPMGFEKDPRQTARILERISAARPTVLVVGLGAPKQELWVHAHRQAIQARVALCVGATIDFLAAEKSRTPRWMRRVGLEWLYRLASEPRRMASRYARDAWIFPRLVFREWARG